MPDKNHKGKIGYSTDANFAASDILSMLRDLPDACCVFKVMTDPFGTVKDMQFLFVNEKYGKLVGKSTAELVGSTFYTAVNNNDEDWIKYSYQAAILRQSSINRTYNTGFDKWFEFWAVPVYQKGFCAFIIHDVTADKQNEDRIKITGNTNDVIIECATALSSGEFNKAIKKTLKILGTAIEADRIQVVKCNDNKLGMIHEWVSSSCSRELPSKKAYESYDMISIWNKQLAGKDVYIQADTTPIIDANEPLYKEFLAGKVSRYMVAPLKHKKELMGFVVADNFSMDNMLNTEKTFVSVAAFIAAEMHNYDLTTELTFLGSHDALTELGNRYSLNQTLLLLSDMSVNVGVCYSDINGLKLINDEQGHEEGDRLIKDTAGIFGSIFKKKNCYRIGGDEFIAIVPDISKEKFGELTDRLKIKCKNVSLAVGSVWIESSKDINAAIKKADEAMYKNKAHFYKTHERRQA